MTENGRRRVAFVSCAPYTGGAERYIELLAAGLDRQKYEAVLVTAGAPGLEPLRSALAAEDILCETTEGKPFSSANGAGCFVRLLKRLRPDIVHINMPGPFDCHYGLTASLARLAGTARIVTTDHLPMIGSFAKARLLRSLHLPHVSRFITVSEDNRSHLVSEHRVPASKIRVVYNGVRDPGAAGPAAVDPEAPVEMLIAGALEERKGHMVLLAAMEQLPGKFRLSIAGDGLLHGKIKEEIASRGFDGRISLLGRVDDMPGLIARSDILVVPSFLEATPYVILEAMAAGRPVVASAIFGIPEQVEDGVTGILVPPGDEASLAGALLRISGEPGLTGKMGEAGRKRYEDRFTLKKSVDETVSVYEELF